eukprot:s107_g10.t1
MPLDRELSQRLEKRRDRTDADPVSPEPVAVDRAYEAHIDQELKSKLRLQSELISRAKTEATGESELKRSAKADTHYARIDQELAKKLQKRQSELQELEATGEAKAEIFRSSAAFEAHIDGELAAKLKKRLDVESRSLQADPELRRRAEETAPGEGDLDGELAQKLRQRRQVVNSQGDVFLKEQIPQEGAETKEVRSTAEAPEKIHNMVPEKRKRRFWWLFCCSLVVAAYGAYQSIPVE